MLKFTVKSTAMTPRDVPTKKGGTWSFQEQDVWAEVNGEYRRIKFRVKRTKNSDGTTTDHPYPVGEYVLSEASFVVNGFGALELGFDVELLPIRTALPKVG